MDVNARKVCAYSTTCAYRHWSCWVASAALDQTPNLSNAIVSLCLRWSDLDPTLHVPKGSAIFDIFCVSIFVTDLVIPTPLSSLLSLVTINPESLNLLSKLRTFQHCGSLIKPLPKHNVRMCTPISSQFDATANLKLGSYSKSLCNAECKRCGQWKEGRDWAAYLRSKCMFSLVTFPANVFVDLYRLKNACALARVPLRSWYRMKCVLDLF